MPASSKADPVPPPIGKLPPPDAHQGADSPPSAMDRYCYELFSVERADLDESLGADWYRYVLASGRSRITGFRRGSLEEVTEYAKDCANAFNLRSSTGKSSRALGLSTKK